MAAFRAVHKAGFHCIMFYLSKPEGFVRLAYTDYKIPCTCRCKSHGCIVVCEVYSTVCYIECKWLITHCIAVADWWSAISTAKLKSTKISYLHVIAKRLSIRHWTKHESQLKFLCMYACMYVCMYVRHTLECSYRYTVCMRISFKGVPSLTISLPRAC